MSRRAQYLEALGIQQWTPRAMSPPPAPLSTAAAAAPRALLETPASSVARASVPAAEASDAVWDRLREQVRDCTRCELCKTRTQTVFGVGNRRAELLVIGEAPGAEEDRQGEPFVGRAGQLLNSMLLAIGLARPSVYIANILKCRPPGNRDPSPAEVASCLPYLQQQIELLRPRLIMAVGRIAAQNLLATDTPIGRLRGQLHQFGTRSTPVIVTYHPAYLLRSPGEKRKAWLDLKFVRRELNRFGEASMSTEAQA